jgi:hypothetical protein
VKVSHILKPTYHLLFGNTLPTLNLARMVLLLTGISYLFLGQNAMAGDSRSSSDGKGPSVIQAGQVALTDLYDAGLALARIQQQAIDIYVDTTRTPIKGINIPEIAIPTTIPVSVSHTDLEFLPPRRDWLVYSVASMEPLIRFLSDDVTDAKAQTKEAMVVDFRKSKLEPCWGAWATHVKSLNDHLTEMLSLFEEAPKNRESIAAQSVAIFEEVDQLEKIRKSACQIIAEDQHLQGCNQIGQRN